MRPNQGNPGDDAGRPVVYQVRLRGHLSDQWAAWFEGFTITRGDDGDTLLIGEVADQAALYGLLRKVRDLGLPLLSLTSRSLDRDGGSELGPASNRQSQRKIK